MAHDVQLDQHVRLDHTDMTPGKLIDAPCLLSAPAERMILHALRGHSAVGPRWQMEVKAMVIQYSVCSPDDIQVPLTYAAQCTNKKQLGNRKAHAILQHTRIQRLDKRGNAVNCTRSRP